MSAARRPVVGEDVRMMSQSHWWNSPILGICPLKRLIPNKKPGEFPHEMGFIHADTGPIVYLCVTIFMIGGKRLDDFEKIEYGSFDEAVADGWIVD